jgi:hypothetical protein
MDDCEAVTGTCGGTKRGRVCKCQHASLQGKAVDEAYRAVKDCLATTTILKHVGSTDIRTGDLFTSCFPRARDGAAASLAVTIAIVVMIASTCT